MTDEWMLRCEDGTASETDYLRSIERSLRTIKGVVFWFLVVSIIGVVVGIMSSVGVFR